MMKNIRLILLSILLSITAFANADNYVAIGKEGKVFDEPNAKYVTLNQKNEEVNVIPGMVFKTFEKTPGWNMIEYSPGLRAYISEQIVNNNVVAPQPGTYTVKNNPSQKVTVENSGSQWTAKVGDKALNGTAKDNIVVFLDANNVSAFSLVDFGQGGIVISYDNNITKFF